MCLNGCGRSGDVELWPREAAAARRSTPVVFTDRGLCLASKGPAQPIVGYSELEHITKFLIIKRLLAGTQAPSAAAQPPRQYWLCPLDGRRAHMLASTLLKPFFHSFKLMKIKIKLNF